MKILLFILIVLLLVLQYHLWSHQGGIAESLHLKKLISQQIAQNNKQTEDNRRIVNKIHALKNEPDATEALAREQLGMIKPGETYYQFVERRSHPHDQPSIKK
jgi:cell division protein FtsB